MWLSKISLLNHPKYLSQPCRYKPTKAIFDYGSLNRNMRLKVSMTGAFITMIDSTCTYKCLILQHTIALSCMLINKQILCNCYSV